MAVSSLETAGKVALIATALDPRHKHLKCVDPNIRLAGRAKLGELVSCLPTNRDISEAPCQVISLDQDALLWWRINECRFKKLGALTEAYLCIPSTSVPAERVFSTAGLIVNMLRSHLSSEQEYVNYLICKKHRNGFGANCLLYFLLVILSNFFL